MQLEWPRTYAYLKEFEEQLRRRAGFRQYFDPARDPFWSMYNVGPYTLAPFKVVWRETADRLVVGSAGPVEGRRAAVPDHTVVLVPVGGAEEMHYLAAMLNSSPVRAFVEGYVALHPSPHVLGFLNIPAFDAENQEHVALAHLSTLAAEAGGCGSAALTAEAQIDERAARLWGMSARDLRAIRAAVR